MNKIPTDLQGPALRRRIRPRAVQPAAPSVAQPKVPDRVQRWVQDGSGSWFMAAMIWLSIFYQVVPSELLEGRLSTLDDMLEPSILFRSIKIFLIASSCAVIAWRAGLALLLLRSVNFLFVCCMLLIAFSFSWSIAPSATIARTVSLATIMVVCFAFVLVGWHPRRFQDALRPAFTVLLVASVLVGLLFPDLGIEQGDDASLKNAWRGVTHQKNSLGLLASFGTIFWLHALLTREKTAWIAAAGVVLSGVCVVLSRSSSSLLSTGLTGVLMMVLLFASKRLRRFMPYIVGGFVGLILFYALAVLNVVPGLSALLAPVAELFGKDTTFSNRSLIWDIIKEHIKLHPTLGTGYGGYWIGPVPSSPSYEFLGRLNFYPTESHNGYLEIVNDLGFIGLAALLGYLIAFVRQSMQLMRIDRNQGVLYLCFFCQQAVANLSESYWLQADFGFTVLTLATFGTARALLGHRLQEYFGTPSPGVVVPR